MENQQLVARLPSNGGLGYSKDSRQLVLNLTQLSELHPEQRIGDVIDLLHQRGVFPSRTTIGRWQRELRATGGTRPRVVSRRGRKGTKLRGRNLVLLALYRVLYPKAMAAEINAALYRFNYGNPFFVSFLKAKYRKQKHS